MISHIKPSPARPGVLYLKEEKQTPKQTTIKMKKKKKKEFQRDSRVYEVKKICKEIKICRVAHGLLLGCLKSKRAEEGALLK